MQRVVNASLLTPEIEVTTSRSSGPGGQNVNKVNTKVTLRFNVPNSQLLTAEEKAVLFTKLKGKLTLEGDILLSSQDKRSQSDNKEAAFKKLDALLTKAFAKRKRRKPTKPTRASVDERIKNKQQRSEKKNWRKRIE
jgi:ribosome-associated protein